MMGNYEYREQAISRIAAYEQNGFYLGERLLITYETLKQPLNMKLVESVIKRKKKYFAKLPEDDK